MIRALLLAAAIACAPARADESAGAAGGRDEVDELLFRARMIMEPSSQIRAAVELLDQKLDAQPRDKRTWLRLADALAMGYGSSRQAKSPLDARRHAQALDPADCHLAGLIARGELDPGPSPILQKWKDQSAPCAEILYVRAKVDHAAELELLGKARALSPSAEVLVALGSARLRQNDPKAAEEPYRAALSAPALFPEDWRMDGWTAVHANLGLAIVYTKLNQPKKARAARKAMRSFLADPGPWHDLSDEEKAWGHSVLGEALN